MTRTISLLALALLLSCSSVARADVQDFTVVNKTGWAIQALFVSESDDDDWQEDILGKDVLTNGASTEIAFSGYGNKTCSFDIRIDDPDDNSWTVEDVDLCKTHQVTFRVVKGHVVYDAR